MPAVANGVVYTSSRATIFALSAQDGSLLWRGNAGGDGTYTSPPTVARGAVFITAINASSSGSFAAAFNASDGTPLWHVGLSPLQPASPPVVFNGVVYVWSDGLMYALSASDGTTRWKTEMGNAGLYALDVG
jgi:outer membrane protein assembly factor BamB